MNTPKLWIVTPVYRDVPSFMVLRERLAAHLDGAPRLVELERRWIVLDDSAGADPAVARLRELDDVRVVEPPFNLGHQRGLVYALRSALPSMADEDLVVTMDSDGEDRPEDVPDLIEPLLEVPPSERLVVLAERSRRAESAPFKLGYWAFRGAFRLLTGTTLRTGNFAAYRAGLARRLLLHPAFDLSYSSAITSLDVPIRHVGCERGRRYEGETRMGYSRLATHGLRMLMPLTERVALRAMVVFGAILVAAIVAGLVAIAIKYLTDAAIPGWTTYMVLGATVITLVALGNLVIVFTMFSQSRAVSLSNLELTAQESETAPRPTEVSRRPPP
jgi:polyisoprenyl-phosphate glycosyltransferase